MYKYIEIVCKKWEVYIKIWTILKKKQTLVVGSLAEVVCSVTILFVVSTGTVVVSINASVMLKILAKLYRNLEVNIESFNKIVVNKKIN